MIGVVSVGRRACRLGGCLAHCEQCVRLADQSLSGVCWKSEGVCRRYIRGEEVLMTMKFLWVLDLQCTFVSWRPLWMQLPETSGLMGLTDLETALA